MNGKERKTARCSGIDYNAGGTFFVTFCTENMSCILSVVEPETNAVRKTEIGGYVDEAIRFIDKDGVHVHEYVIMPNHVHMLIGLDEGVDVCGIVGRIKSYSTKCAGKRIWQRSFHDHKVRDRRDGDEIRRYIVQNPLKWSLDRYYSE